jgi:CheY-like chemotaxis protein
MLGSSETGAPGGARAEPAALVVDDDKAVAALLAAFLERMGLAVTVAHSHGEGERRLADGPWALFVTDLQLGGGAGSEGLDLVGLARRSWPAARTILISGSAGPEMVNEARAHGADLFLAKPISYAQLSTSVRSLLDTPPRA